MTTEAVPFYRTHIVLSPVDNPPNTCDALARSEIATNPGRKSATALI
jgi:hypothetical protein